VAIWAPDQRIPRHDRLSARFGTQNGGARDFGFRRPVRFTPPAFRGAS